MSSYDLSRLFVKYHECPPDRKLSEWAPQFSAFPEFTKCDDNRIKVAILSGDVESPFIRINERDTMMRAIFDELNIDTSINKKMLDDCIYYRDEKMLFAWVKYMQIVNEVDFTDWQLVCRDYDYFLQQALKPKDKDEDQDKYDRRRKANRDEVRKLGEEKKSIEAKLFPDSEAARQAAIAESKKKIALYAERYAEPFNYF